MIPQSKIILHYVWLEDGEIGEILEEKFKRNIARLLKPSNSFMK